MKRFIRNLAILTVVAFAMLLVMAPSTITTVISQLTIYLNGGVVRNAHYVVSSKGKIWGNASIPNDGADFGPDTKLGSTSPRVLGPPYTTTCGLQEAIDSLPRAADKNDRSKPGGGELRLTPGIFWTTDTIATHRTANSNAFTLTINGAGMTATCIVNTNDVPVETLAISTRGHGTLDNFWMENIGVFCKTNAMTNIVSIRGPNSGGADTFGGVARANIRFCYIAHWTRATNNPCFGFTPSSCAVDSAPNNLIAIKVDCNFDDVITLEANSINYCNGISVAADHVVVRDNMFEHCGITQNSAANDWPNTSIYRGGGAITITEPGGSVNGSWDGVTAINGNKAWTFSGNIFVNCARPYIIADQFNRDHYSVSDDFENCGVQTSVSTTGSKWTFVNMRSCASFKTYYVTNVARWDTAATQEATNSFYHLYMQGGVVSITNLNGGALGRIVGAATASTNNLGWNTFNLRAASIAGGGSPAIENGTDSPTPFFMRNWISLNSAGGASIYQPIDFNPNFTNVVHEFWFQSTIANEFTARIFTGTYNPDPGVGRVFHYQNSRTVNITNGLTSVLFTNVFTNIVWPNIVGVDILSGTNATTMYLVRWKYRLQ